MPSRTPRPDKIRVLLCDDHAVVREGTRRLLEEEPDIEVVGEAQDGLEATKKAQELAPHIVAMDVSMPVMNGIEATRLIKARHPEIYVLALTAYDDFAYVSRLLMNGASGYILKSARGPEIVAAIRAAALGESVLDPGVARAVFSRIARAEPSQIAAAPLRDGGEDLTPKETEVVRFLSRGLSNKEIAGELGLSPRTIQAHLASVFSKLGVASRTEAVVAALRAGVLSRDDLGMSQGPVENG